MSYFKNYIVFILFVILFGVQTDLSSQKTKENYPNLTGFWKIKNGNIVHIYQVGNVVYYTNRENQWFFIHKGTFTNSKTVNMNCKYIPNNSRVTKHFTGKLTVVNSKELLWEWDNQVFESGSQKLEYLTSD
jgi:hypothetical protein